MSIICGLMKDEVGGQTDRIVLYNCANVSSYNMTLKCVQLLYVLQVKHIQNIRTLAVQTETDRQTDRQRDGQVQTDKEQECCVIDYSSYISLSRLY